MTKDATPARPGVEKLTKARRLSREISAILKEPVELYGAKGWYRHRRADCMPFTGWAGAGSNIRSIGCWRTMTTCLRNGFAVVDTIGELRPYNRYDIEPFDDGSGIDPFGDPLPGEIGRWLPSSRITPAGRQALDQKP